MSGTLSVAPRAGHVVYEPVEPFTSMPDFYIRLAIRYVHRGRTATILRQLSDAHLRDVGIDRSLVHSGPEFKVDARVMTDLMSLR